MPAVITLLDPSDIGLSSILYNYIRTASDGSIDVFLTDYDNNIAVIHIDSNRDISIENYKYTVRNNSIYGKLNINRIGSIMGDEFGIAIYDNLNKRWYYINRYTRCISEIGKGENLTFSNELYKIRQRKKIKEEDISGLVPNVQGIIGEYYI